MFKAQRPGPYRQPLRLRYLADRLRRVDHVKDPLGGGLENANLRHELGEPLQRVPELPDVVHEDDQHADRHPASDGLDELVAVHQVTAVPQDDRPAYGKDRIPRQWIELLLPIEP